MNSSAGFSLGQRNWSGMSGLADAVCRLVVRFWGGEVGIEKLSGARGYSRRWVVVVFEAIIIRLRVVDTLNIRN